LCVARAALPLALQEAAEREPPAACVSSFGFGGANAHLVLRAASAAERSDEVPTPDREAALPPLVLSAATDAALAALAQRWRAHVAEAIDAPDALCAAIETADGRRTRQATQAVLAARKPTGLLKALDALADGRSDPRVTSCRAQTPEARGIALVFSGNGAQWGGMGQWLLTDPLGADRFNEAAAAISAAGGPDLAALMAAPDREERLQDSLAAQSLLWAQQVAAACSIVAQLEARGLAPRLVMGHSVGEVAAACAAGCLRLRDAARLIVNRACAVRPLRDSGAMAALLTDRDTAAALMAEVGAPDSLALAADNSPRSVTVSGDSAAVDALAAIARSRRIALRKLPVPFPYHAPALDGVEDALRAAAAGLAPQHGQLRLISTVTGARIAPVALTDDHWWRNARQPVRFREGVETAIAEGCGLFIEIGPRPVLGAYVRDCLSASSATGLCLSSEPGPGREDAATSPAALAAIAQGHVQASGDTACAARRPPHAGHAGLPRYPWQRRKYRAAPSASGGDLYGLVPLKSGRARSALLGHRDRAGCGPWLGSIDAA
ncbi:MAG: acyltransferase domain-containing protein, partial [Pseudomonadota bacterium]